MALQSCHLVFLNPLVDFFMPYFHFRKAIQLTGLKSLSGWFWSLSPIFDTSAPIHHYTWLHVADQQSFSYKPCTQCMQHALSNCVDKTSFAEFIRSEEMTLWREEERGRKQPSEFFLSLWHPRALLLAQTPALPQSALFPLRGFFKPSYVSSNYKVKVS